MDGRLAQKARARVVGQLLGIDDLHCDRRVVARVARRVDDGVSAATELTFDAIAARQHVAGLEDARHVTPRGARA